MKAFLAIISKDITLAFRNGGSTLTLLTFFISIGVIMPIAIGPNKQLLGELSPSIIWIAALLSTLLGLDRLFVADHEDGTLRGLQHANVSFVAIALAKLIAHWLITALPLILATPILAVMLFMDMQTFIAILISLLLGTPALISLGAIGAAIAVTLKRGGIIAPILIMPLAIPILIFGISATNSLSGPSASNAALLFLSAFSLLTLSFAPFAIALALKTAAE